MNKDISTKTCIINSHGRFLESSKEFALSLSLRQRDIEFRYLLSYFKSDDEWKRFKQSMSSESEFTFDTRLRKKYSRSFEVTMVCKKLTDTRYGISIL